MSICRMPRFKIQRYLLMFSITLVLTSLPLLLLKTTVSSPSFYQTFYDNHSQTYDVSKPIYNSTFALADSSAPRYLWCVNYYGPNNQLKNFIKCSIIAMMNNFTVVIPPLFPHYQDKMQSIQCFLHFYDVEQFVGWLKFVTFENFIQQIQTSPNQAMIDCYMKEVKLPSKFQEEADINFKAIENHYQMKIDYYRYVNLSTPPRLNDFSQSAEKCTSVLLHCRYLTFGHLLPAQSMYVQRFFQRLHRNSIIKRMAAHIISLLHESAIGNYSKNNPISLAVAHMRLGDRVVLSVPLYTMQILQLIQNGVHFTHLHVMCPYLTSTDINYLTNNLPVAITTTSILFKHVSRALDDYLFDVLEQEIAVQAAIFIASPWTTYSSTVVLQKLHQNKGIVYTFSDNGKNRTLSVNINNATYYFK